MTTDTTIRTTRTLYVVIRDQAGAQVTPGVLACTVQEPSGTVIELDYVEVEVEDLAKASEAIGQTLSGTTGVYQADVTPEVVGTWDVHWQATAPTVAIDSWFQVPWPRVPAEGS